MAKKDPSDSDSKQKTSSRKTKKTTSTAGKDQTGAGERIAFTGDAPQILNLVIHSLYSHREIFLRELISNAADAIEKIRFEAINNDQLLADDSELKIILRPDKAKRVLEIEDNGIGMTRQEVIENLGTIARSGTARFAQTLTGDKAKDSSLIGQFGVGFYSAFIVAEKVEVLTRHAADDNSQGVYWSSDGNEVFTIETKEQSKRGTTVRLHLRADAQDFSDSNKLRNIVKTYSDCIATPVLMPALPNTDETKEADNDGLVQVNQASALWRRHDGKVSDNDYIEFYKQLSGDFETPLKWSLNRVEGNIAYTSLLFIPRQAPFDLWQRDGARGLKLYVQRTFILDHAEQFLPLYLRFVKGVIETTDLPLNISREMLQNTPEVDKIRAALARRVLNLLDKMADENPEDYKVFWQACGQVLKEGPVEDPNNRERITKLLRFCTTCSEGDDQDRSLADYQRRMGVRQKHIYYICSETLDTARHSPQLEIFRDKDVEVLLLHNPLDEWLMSMIQEYEGKRFKDITRGELNLEEEGFGNVIETPDGDIITPDKNNNKDHDLLIERITDVLKDQVSLVRTTERLVDSPACLSMAEHDMGRQMRRMFSSAGQEGPPETQPILEINPSHPLVQHMQNESDDKRFNDWTSLLLDQATLAGGEQLKDPAAFVHRLNRLVLSMV